MDKTREEFITWIRIAMNDRKSLAYEELYQFLVNCFTRSDPACTGRIYLDRFDGLIEEAAAMPRKYGYAPVTSRLYPTLDERKVGREKQFKQIDRVNQGYISLDQWVEFAVNHILAKITELPKDYLGGSSSDVTKEEFVDFIRKAVVKGTPEYKELYFFLLKTFQSGDVNRVGRVDPIAFDKMIEDAAAAPRRFGLAPKSEEMFANAQARLAKRKEYFSKMDTDNNGYISFDEWLHYALEHIIEKVATI